MDNHHCSSNNNNSNNGDDDDDNDRLLNNNNGDTMNASQILHLALQKMDGIIASKFDLDVNIID